MKFTSTEINTDSHALMFYGNVEQYAVKPIEYIDEDFKLITFKPEGNTRETYREESKKESFIYPLRFTQGQEPGSTRMEAHLVAIGDKSTLTLLKSAYETIAAHAKPILSSHPVIAALLHLAKNDPHSMSNQQLQELERQPLIPDALKNTLKALQAENTSIPTSDLIHCHEPPRQQVTLWRLMATPGRMFAYNIPRIPNRAGTLLGGLRKLWSPIHQHKSGRCEQYVA